MKLYLKRTLTKLNKEVRVFTPRTSLLSRKYSLQNKQKIFDWMSQYCQIYHTLVSEFNPNTIKFTKQKINKQTHDDNLEYLFFKILNNKKYNSHLCKNLRFDEHIIIDLQKIKSTQSLAEWFNKYNVEIYDNSTSTNINFIDSLRNYRTFLVTQKGGHKGLYKNESMTVVLLEHEILDILNTTEQIINHLENSLRFISLKIRQQIDLGFKYLYQYKDAELSFKLQTNEIIEIDNVYWSFLYARMKSVYRLYIKNHSENIYNKTPINFDIYLLDTPKYFPRKGKVFGPDEVNSGCTYQTSITDKYINIWRKEEHFKLILHESIHYYNVDHSHNFMREKVDVNCHYQIINNEGPRIFEALTESLTVFLNSFANAYQIYYLENQNQHQTIKTKPILDTLDLQKIDEIREELFHQEKKFFALQIAKIFKHINPDSLNFKSFLIKPEQCEASRNRQKHKLEETTSLLSYHIIKGTNIIFDQEFLDWIHNPINFNISSFNSFFKHISEKTHSPLFINFINQALKYIKELEDNGHKISNSLRMTLYETELGV
jgi:hypothetical protein